MADLKRHCNVYGFLGAFTAVSIDTYQNYRCYNHHHHRKHHQQITCAVAYFIVNSKGEECFRDYDKLQYFHMVGIVGGIVLCICGVFNIAGMLYDIIILFYVATLAVVALGVVQAYAAYYTFPRPCMPALGFLPFDSGLGLNSDRNVFSAEDGKMIGVFILDICSALMFLSASGNFFRRM